MASVQRASAAVSRILMHECTHCMQTQARARPAFIGHCYRAVCARTRGALHAAAVCTSLCELRASRDSLVRRLQVLKALKNKSEIRVLDDVVKIAPQLLSQIISMTRVDIPENSHITARCLLKLGIGISGGICLGWADTKGFHMVGCRGSVSAAASIGGDIMAGLHHTRKFVKAILGISNICVEMVFELPAPAETGKAGDPDQRVTQDDIAEVVAQGDAQREELGVEKPVSTAADVQPADAEGGAAEQTEGAGLGTGGESSVKAHEAAPDCSVAGL